MGRIYILLLLLFVLPGYAGAAAPQQRVSQMIDGVFAVLNTDLPAEVKKQQISGTVQKYLGMKSLSQRTLGRFWKGASREDLDRFMGLYVQILEKTYLSRVEDYSGGKVNYLRERIKGNKAILDTEFVSEKFNIPVQYKMVNKKNVWQIYDVLIEGVSLVRSYRSSYGEILRKEGFDGLFKRMSAKVAAVDKAD